MVLTNRSAAPGNKIVVNIAKCPLGSYWSTSSQTKLLVRCFFAGGYLSDSAAFVATECQECPVGAYVKLDIYPGTRHKHCRACPRGDYSLTFIKRPGFKVPKLLSELYCKKYLHRLKRQKQATSLKRGRLLFDRPDKGSCIIFAPI